VPPSRQRQGDLEKRGATQDSMPTTQIPETVRRIFTETFTARDVAEPLTSFDSGTSAAEVRDCMTALEFDVVGVRRGGRVAGYVHRSSLENGACGDHLRAIEDSQLLQDTAPLMKVLTALSCAPILFVSTLGGVGGIITAADLQKPPVRMWLFGVVTLIEMRCTELIEHHCPDDSWKPYLSEGRLQKAQTLLVERTRRNQSLRLLDCLQFSDKGQIIARHEELRNQTIFTSRRQTEDAVSKLEQLRNNLAHAQDIPPSDWDTIVQLCAFITR
jgi:hypothetical protein